MCGIAGIISLRIWPESVKTIEKVTGHQVPRGPDVRAVHQVNAGVPHVVFGHNRLSIIDLTEGSDQPMWDVANDLCIVFNGEIYNFIELRAELQAFGHRFRTKGDTEVILAAYRQWGTEAFPRLLGMFAFALYDRRSRHTLLVRDRFGVKPLMYRWRGNILAFASSGLALADAFGLAPNLDYAARGMRSRIYEDETSLTAFESLSAVEPGTYVEIRADAAQLKVTRHRYYDLLTSATAKAEAIAGLDEGGQIQHLEEILHEAVRIRLRSDVEVGLSLSGGIDSSLIACLCNEAGVKLRAFSFGEPDDRSSEAPLVELLGRMLGLELEFVTFRNREELEEGFWRTLEAQEAPFSGPSLLAQYAVFRRVRDAGVRVLLGGQGGDEAFMGYRKFFLFYAQEILRRRALSELPRLAMTLCSLPLGNLSKVRFLWRERRRYLPGKGTENIVEFPGMQAVGLGLGSTTTLFERQVLDATRLSLPTLLRYEDRNSGGNSIETRLPFVDHRVVEFGMALPTSSKLRLGRGKWILRSLLSRRGVKQIAWNRVKRGFDVNERKWLSLGLGDLLREAIRTRKASLAEVLPEDLDLDRAFSDARLLENHIAFTEAVSLIWLADRVQQRGASFPSTDAGLRAVSHSP